MLKHCRPFFSNWKASYRLYSNLYNKSKINYFKMSHESNASILQQQNNIYFGTEVVNRVSFLREDNEFISNSVTHPSTRFIFFKDTNPLVIKKDNKLVELSNGCDQYLEKDEQIIRKGILTSDLWKNTVNTWSEDNKNTSPDLRDNGKPTFVFLGIKDESVGLSIQKLKSYEENEQGEERYLDHQGRYQGVAYYAVDLSHSKELQTFVINHVVEETKLDASEIFFTHSRKHYLGFSHEEAALYSHGKMLLDWLSRNKFCPGCGSKVIPIHSGGKIKCTNDDKEGEKYKCPVKNVSVSNVSFPRTDAVIITAITNKNHDKILLSLSKRYSEMKMYACTAGFMEPSETVEVATKREIWEETGVVCSKINIVLSQPWPFPGNLMIGCLAEVDFNGENEVIHLGHDRELADARWFDISFVRNLIDESAPHDNPEGILLPNPESIAFLLIKLVVDKSDSKSTKL